MSGYFIGTSIVINDDAAYIHESFSTVGVGTTENVKILHLMLLLMINLEPQSQ